MSADSNAPGRSSGYTTSGVIIHWLLAVLIFFLFISSWWMMALPLPSRNFNYRAFPFQLHKNIGITLLPLLGILLYVRLKHRPSADPSAAMQPWMRRFAVVDHVALYVLIALCALSGYASSSYSGWQTKLWWLIALPNWGYDNNELNEFYSNVHLWTAWALLAFIAVHLTGVLYHAFRNDGAVRRLMRLVGEPRFLLARPFARVYLLTRRTWCQRIADVAARPARHAVRKLHPPGYDSLAVAAAARFARFMAEKRIGSHTT